MYYFTGLFKNDIYETISLQKKKMLNVFARKGTTGYNKKGISVSRKIVRIRTKIRKLSLIMYFYIRKIYKTILRTFLKLSNLKY